ncbi:MAG: DUF2892 domain-containing protein [Magnetococcales bacterium]|nr:DUF2892 domain-containing protein [Magnetococcales bacterium]
MKANVGNLDRGLRILIGVVILPQAFIGLQTPWAWLGLIPLLTGFIRFCPIYPLVGLNTCSTEDTSR